MAKEKIPFPELLRRGWGPYMQLLRFIGPYRARFAWGLAFGLGFAAFNAIIPFIIQRVGGEVFKPGLTPQNFMDAASGSGGSDLKSVIGICLLVPAVMIIRSIFSYLNSYCMAWVSLKVLRDLRRELFARVIHQSMEFFNTAKAGKLIARVINDTRVAQNALMTIAANIFKDSFAVVAGAAALVILDWKFSLTTLVLFPICIIPIAIYGRKVRKAGKAEEDEAGVMAVILQETFAGIRAIKGFAREDYQVEQFEKSSDLQFKSSIRVRKSIDIVQPMIETISALGVSVALFYVYMTGLTVGKFAALLFGIFLLYEPVKRLSRLHMLMQKCLAATTNIFALIDRKPTVNDPPDAPDLPCPEGRIVFDDVTFSYRDDRPPALEGFSHVMEPGKRYALVGASGAGKSTVLSLLLRFYDPQGGHVLVDGRDIRSVTLKSLREHIGIVSQETFLFHDTIAENIRYGRLDATPAEIEAAAKLAYAHDFILAQPEGYNTVVGDKGCQLSGGQQQRITIARALLKNAPILLLDEATSALDSESERVIQSALDRLARGRTVIAIAHRLSTILNSDEILVMDHGRLIDRGPHAQLLEKSALYRKLYELQFHHERALGA